MGKSDQCDAHCVCARGWRMHDCHASDRERDDQESKDDLEDMNSCLVLLVEGDLEPHDDQVIRYAVWF